MTRIIFEYFKKELDEASILVRINPNTFEGLELTRIIHDTVMNNDDK